MTDPLLGAILALATVAVLMPFVLLGMHRLAVLDVPNQRSSHQLPTPRGGGVAIALGLPLAIAVVRPDGDATILVICLSSGFAIVGLLDDMRPVGAVLRLCVQLVLAAVGAAVLVDRTGRTLVILIVLATIWIAGFVNSFNFMDGVNGISSLTAIAMGSTWWSIGVETDMTFVAVGGAALAGAALGFLPWNAPMAKIFLGDVGSYLMGAWLALLGVVAWTEGLDWWLAVWPASIYLADTAVTAARRVMQGEPWHESHRQHVYQRVVRSGWSHTESALLVSGSTAAIGGIMFAVVSGRMMDLLGLAFVVVVVLAYLSTPWVLARRLNGTGVLDGV